MISMMHHDGPDSDTSSRLCSVSEWPPGESLQHLQCRCASNQRYYRLFVSFWGFISAPVGYRSVFALFGLVLISFSVTVPLSEGLMSWIFTCCVMLRQPNQCFRTVPSNYSVRLHKGNFSPGGRNKPGFSNSNYNRQATTSSGMPV